MESTICGLSSYRPQWLQRFANARTFLVVHGLLGTVQLMCDVYFAVTVTTLEKQYKIRAQTVGMIISSNLMSQATLSLILSYVGEQRNRPKWIAGSVLLGSISCALLASPHFIFGVNKESLQLTQEYFERSLNVSANSSTTSTISDVKTNSFCSNTTSANPVCDSTDQVFSYLPLILIFVAQFTLGIGTALYFSLGQSYLDDNVKMKDSPFMQSASLSLRWLGPLFGFYLGFLTLRIYIDPTKTPTITHKDPRWIGAWWLGWIICSFLLLIFSVLIALFPRRLPKRTKSIHEMSTGHELKQFVDSQIESEKGRDAKPLLKDFPIAVKRLLTNKLLMLNYGSSIFYVLGSHVYHTFLTKYIEVQFNKTAAAATIFTGPLSICGMVIGALSSGYLMTEYKIHARKLYFWCVLCGTFAICARIVFTQLTCDDLVPPTQNATWKQPDKCNAHCNCDNVPFNPVCATTTRQSFYSACHAGCQVYNDVDKFFSNCSCVDVHVPELGGPVTQGVCAGNCDNAYTMFTIFLVVTNLLQSTGIVSNFMLNFRAVEVRDKALTHAMGVAFLCFFALMPSPILFGKIMDGSCKIWNEKCGERGNCLLYDRDLFRFLVNWTSVAFTSIGVFFDVLVWHHSKHLDLYGPAD